MPNKYYDNIVDLPLNKFIDVEVNGNFAALIIEGFPAESELHEAWELIKIEYADAIGDNEHVLYMMLLRNMTSMEMELSIIENHVNVLSKMPFNVIPLIPEAEAEIKGFITFFGGKINEILGTDFQFYHTDLKNYHNELQRCLNRSKAIKINIDLKADEIEAIKKKFEEDAANGQITKPTKQYYHSILITLTDHAKVHISDSITVYEFCERIRRFNKYCQDMAGRIKKENG